MSERKLCIYTDGACRGNPGPGSWGVLMVYNGTTKEFGGVQLETTNNRMELTAAIEALSRVKHRCPICLTTDSLYLRDGITQWLAQWKRNSWKTSGRKPVKNVDLWRRLDTLASRYSIEWQWVRGHTGHPGNERADAIANEYLDRLLFTDGDRT